MKLPDSLYQKFTPRERLSLFWDAMARKDYAEADRLEATCERRTYRMPDADYQYRVEVLMILCLYTASFIDEATIRVMAAMCVLVHGQDTRDDDMFDAGIYAYIKAVGQVRGTWAAWSEFCDTVKVDPVGMMKGCLGGVPTLVASTPMPEVDRKITPDEESRAAALGLFQGQWSRLEERLASRA